MPPVHSKMCKLDDPDLVTTALAAAGYALILRRRANIRRRKAKKRFWVKDWLLKRPTMGWYNTLLNELKDGRNYNHPEDTKRFLRVDEALFQDILAKVGPIIQKQDTNYRKAITTAERLSLTLRFLAVGNLDLEFGFRVSRSSIYKIVPETVDAITQVYGHLIHLPETSEEWLDVAHRFERRWNFNHCVGAIDGKHIAIRKPPDSGSLYYNYKKFFSIILMAVVNADLRFMYVNVGTEGRVGDAALFRDSDLGHLFENGEANLPAAEPFPGDNIPMNYYLAGDGAFALKEYMMTPYSNPRQGIMPRDMRIYNYRHSRARRIVECAFGVLCSRYNFLQPYYQ